MAARITVAAFLLSLVIGACGPSDSVEDAERHLATGNQTAALHSLRKLLAEHPDDPRIHFLYGRALVQSGHPALAEWSLREAMSNSEWRVPAGLELAKAQLRASNFDGANDTLTRVLETEPDRVDALLMRAEARAGTRRHLEAALEDVERVLDLDPDNLDAYGPRIVALIGLDRVEEARDAFSTLGERIEDTQIGDSVRVWYCATNAIFTEERGELEEAEGLYDDCLAQSPADMNVVSNAVRFHDGRGNSERSLEILHAALRSAPRNNGYRVALAARLLRLERAREGETLLQEATEFDVPEARVRAWLDLAKYHQTQGEHEQGADAAGRAVETAREFGEPTPQLLFEWADALLLAHAYDQALELARTMTVASHRAFIEGRVALARGRAEEALAHFSEGFRLWPNNAWARYYAALAAERTGDFDRVVEELRYSIRIDPEATDARVRLAQLHAAEGQADVALQVLYQGAQRTPLSLEGELLGLRLLASLGRREVIETRLQAFTEEPARLATAIAAVADGVSAHAGPAAAARFVASLEVIDLEDPLGADALRAYVRHSHDAGSLEMASERLAKALREHPGSGVLYEIRGLELELRGGRQDELRSAYERAVELDPNNFRALIGLGRAISSSASDRAVSLLDRAARVAPHEIAPRSAAISLLLSLGRLEEADQRLESLLIEWPYAAGEATRLAELKLDVGRDPDRALELAHRAVRFGGGPEAQAILAQALRAESESQSATRAGSGARSDEEDAEPSG